MSPVSTRVKLGLGAAVALAVTLVFALVGDGVSTTRGGPVGWIVNHAHTVVWALLTVALGLAAALGRWQAASGAIAVAALVSYGVFLVTVLAVA